MPTYSAPGVYIEETPAGARAIEPVPTSTAAFLGETERGPMCPVFVADYSEYTRRFGEAFSDDAHMPFALKGFFANGGRRACVCRIAGSGATSAACTIGDFTIAAIGPGAWGNRVVIKIGESTSKQPGTGAPIGFRLQIAYWSVPAPPGGYPDAFAAASAVQMREDFDDLVCDDPASPNHVEQRLENASVLVRVSWPSDRVPALPPATASASLADGIDGSPPDVLDFQGVSIGTGLAALDDDQWAEVSLLNAPAAPDEIVAAIVAHCERARSRFAIVDCARDAVMPTLNPAWESSYAAFYYPWLLTAGPEGGPNRMIPPGGAVLGAYARTDTDRGVWKAPANDTLNGVIGLSQDINKREQDLVDPRVNSIRMFQGRGIRIWGARTLSNDPIWKYVSTRRLFQFIERSIKQGIAWVVFEPNDERCWGRVRDVVENFLNVQWRAGAFSGASEKEAFFVKCDRSTMTAEDIAQGLLICEIGVAPIRPAEFVILRVEQKTA